MSAKLVQSIDIITKHYNDMIFQNIETGMVTVQQMAEDLETALASKDENAPHVDKSIISNDRSLQSIDQSFKEMLKVMNQSQKEFEILESLKQELLRGNVHPDDASKWLAAQYEEQVDGMMGQSVDQHEKYLEFRGSVWQIRNPTTAFAGDDEMESDDDLKVVSQYVVTKCPLTQNDLQTVYTTTTCGHSYSEAIFDFIQRNRGMIKCAVTGCNRDIRQSDVKKDIPKTKKVKRILQMAQRREIEGIDIDG